MIVRIVWFVALAAAAGCVTEPCVALCEEGVERAWECGADDPACYGSESDMQECRDLCSDPVNRSLDPRSDEECAAQLASLDQLSCEQVLERWEE